VSTALAGGRPEARRRPSSVRKGGWPRAILEAVLVLLLATAIFDPADLVLGFKVELFLLCWALFLLVLGIDRQATRVPVGLLLYILVFLWVPIASIAWYFVSDGSTPFQGFALLKGYLLITLCLLLYLARINLLPHLCGMLTLLAMCVLGVFFALMVEPSLLTPLQIAGAATGVALFMERDYGSGLVMMQIYFVTSPMLAISIAYYLGLLRRAPTRRAKLLYLALVLINCAGMFIAGTRNNMLVALLLPLTMYFLYSRNKVVGLALSSGLLVFGVMLYQQDLRTFFDPNEYSNSMKLELLRDYWDLFTQPTVLLTGQGLGAYHFWTPRGWQDFISELTYLEMIRNFGLMGAAVMMVLLVYPLIYAFLVNRSFEDRDVVVGYAFYLGMCASNPNLFSSMGMLILPVILANIFLAERQRARAVHLPASA